MAGRFGIGQFSTASTSTLALPDLTDGWAYKVYKVWWGGAVGVGVTGYSVGFQSIDPSGGGTRAFLYPATASTNVAGMLDFTPDGVVVWRAAPHTGHTVIFTSTGGNFVAGGLIMVNYDVVAFPKDAGSPTNMNFSPSF